MIFFISKFCPPLGLQTSLLFIPSHAPYNLYSENYEKGLDLYAKGVFIKEKCKELVPDYLKFVKGVVDSDDFSLNISREILQSNPVINKIATNIDETFVYSTALIPSFTITLRTSPTSLVCIYFFISVCSNNFYYHFRFLL